MRFSPIALQAKIKIKTNAKTATVKKEKTMKLINRKRSLKFVGLQIAVITAILAVQMIMSFFAQNRILVIQGKTDSWQTIAGTAQGELSACNSDLSALQKARDLANQDILGE